ncbi:MAG: hypothetical protein LBQ00_08400 [Syntrophobacterales bacterium]|nr:hypothetical protein [Syntrophobacterales bacterium]
MGTYLTAYHDEMERFEIFQIYTREKPRDNEVELAEFFTDLTEDMACYEIVFICRKLL